MSFLATMMPKNMYETISATVLDIVSNQRGGLLTFGFAAALYLATNGMSALINAFNACYRTTESRRAWRVRLTATALTLLLALVLLLTVIMVIAGQILLDYIGANLREFSHLQVDEFTLFMFQVMRLVVVFTGFFLAISCIYYFGPSVHYNWNFFSIGSFVATLGSMAVSYGFSAYVTGIGSYNKLYGSIGVLIALMVWIQLLSVVLLGGYELNSTLHRLEHEARPRLKKN
jgi:membrane protein